ncbi:MAG: diaminopimelate epimerase [Clostridia bacterium]|nr:diaminopimelate epimerase [Clostridia bacterium]
MEFVKMHGIGNDYVYVDCFAQPAPENPGELSVRMSMPHTGIGADGLILIEPSACADARMRIFNKDGSEGEMCGNGIRCVGKYLYDSALARRDVITVETRGGVKTLEMLVKDGRATGARVDMGEAVFEPERIPVRGESNTVTLRRGAYACRFFCLNIGNPHAVTSDVFPEGRDFEQLGSAFERDSAFPARANVSFIKVVSRRLLRARIWERGSGPTLACGTGATASVIAAYKTGLCESSAQIELPGGKLFIEYDERTNHAFMTGPAEISFTGKWQDTL